MIFDSEELIFKKWEVKRPDMCKDGVVSELDYLVSEIKVLYVLKEVNDWKKGDLRNFLKGGARWRTWNNISRWQLGIQTYFETGQSHFKDKISHIDRKKILRNIAVLNLKKASGGSVSDMSEIKRHAREDLDLLKEQIALYTPHIIICCGTGKIFSSLQIYNPKIAIQTSSDGIKYAAYPSCLIIQHYHPQCRKKKKFLFHSSMEIIKHALPSRTLNRPFKTP